MPNATPTIATRRLGGRLLCILLCIGLAACGGSSGEGGVRVKFDPADPAGGPFPSNRFTVTDLTQNTSRRVNLPKPDCTVRPSDCADIDVINTLDGFSTQPRITIPFTGDIDVASVNSDTVFLLNLGDTRTSAGAGQKIGSNQIVWDPATRTLAFESDEHLNEHSHYLLIVTDGVRDASGKKLKAASLEPDDSSEYGRELRDVLNMRIPGDGKVAAASLFTTQSITADLVKIMQKIKQSPAVPANFMVGNNGTVRALFPVAGTNIQFNRQTGAAPSTFTSSFLPAPALGLIPESVGQIAYGTFSSPDYQTASQHIPATGTLSGQPARQGTNALVFQLFLPAGAMPAGGWPVAIFGHAVTDSMYGAPWLVASVLASKGIASVAINAVGHGGGAEGSLNVLRPSGAPVTIPAGGRGIDQDGNGIIDSIEGLNAAPPRTIIFFRDGLRQTVIDIMQLVRQIEAGMDADGDGVPDLNPQRIYYAGQSLGGIYGTILLGVESSIKAGVANVAGGSIAEVARLGSFRPLAGTYLATRTPTLINVQDPGGIAFNENMPLRNVPAVINAVPGAMAIQQALDRLEWVQQSGNPVAYASFIRKQPLPGSAAKPVLFQFGRGDKTVPNPTTTAVLRAGNLADVAVQFRNDLAVAANPALPTNPHTFLTRIGAAATAPYALGAQTQIAIFFQTNGATVIDPDGAGPIFEVPSSLPLPEGLNFIP